MLAADRIRRETGRPKSRPGWGMESVFLAGNGGHKSGTIATSNGPNFSNFCAGIRAHFAAQIPAQQNRRSEPHPSQKTGRLLMHFCPGSFTSSTALLMLGPPPLLPAPWGQIQTFFSTVNRFLVRCRGIGISKRQSSGTGTPGNGTLSPKTVPIFRA